MNIVSLAHVPLAYCCLGISIGVVIFMSFGIRCFLVGFGIVLLWAAACEAAFPFLDEPLSFLFCSSSKRAAACEAAFPFLDEAIVISINARIIDQFLGSRFAFFMFWLFWENLVLLA